MAAKSAEETPLMKQYYSVKEKYPGAVILFRVGDFYETFGSDAVKTSSITGITLTKRGNGSASEIELAGFPHHSLQTYLPKLIKAGVRVAVCDQLEDPKMVKGIVKRGVTELVTPGIVFNDNVLHSNFNNYLASIHFGDKIGVSFIDISTGDFFCTQGNLAFVERLFQSLQPAEVIFSKKYKKEYESAFLDKFNSFSIDEWVYRHEYAYETLTTHFGTNNLKGFGIEELTEAITAAGGIIHYLKSTEHHELKHLASISRLEDDRFVWLDKFTIRNLELVFPQYEGGVALIDILDKTLTPMGSRLMKRWLVMPLKNLQEINQRQAIVQALLKKPEQLSGLEAHLKPIGDLERLISKVAAKRINPREMVQLKRALQQLKPLVENLKELNNPELNKKLGLINPCDFLVEKIEKELKNDVSILTNQGNLINDGIHEELDQLRAIAYSGKDYLLQITQREIERTGISSLKIQYNKVFGYFLEVTNTHKDKVPSDWIRKQTMVNGERYITQELKIYEEKILTAEDKIVAIEQTLFNELVACALGYVGLIQQDAKILAEIDCLASFASSALKDNYCKPQISENSILDIKEGRHPVIEKQLPKGENYVPNDIYLDDAMQQIIIITGPNMAGKSALLRQTAIIVLMAQMGSFVPAKAAKIGLVDKIFTRVGASDNLSKGESTFMVEMNETASILNNLSEKSLIIMDEIGRGTSTYDGISIAWSIVEHLHNHPKFKPKTLFATHYHELNELAKEMPRVKNYNVSVKEAGGKIHFMRILKEGGAEHSFGIHVAQLAGMPNGVVIRANEIMHELEKDKVQQKTKQKVKEIPKVSYQMSIFEANDPNYLKVKEILEQTDINLLSPLEALLKLNHIKTVFEGK
jgi:DNA mismatch repair protein MutS